MDVIEKITTMITPSINAMGYEIVQLRMADNAKRKTLTLMTERKDDTMMTFDDCTEISHTVSALLDVEDPIVGAYDLEVCSPGVDRPLVKLADYQRFTGYDVKIDTLILIEGKKRFKGVIETLAGEVIHLKTEEKLVEIPFSSIKQAKLIATDELMRKFLKQQKQQTA